MPWGGGCHQAHKVDTNTKETLFIKCDAPFILGISFFNLNQFTDSCRFITLTKEIFKGKHKKNPVRIFFIDIILLPYHRHYWYSEVVSPRDRVINFI